MKAIILSGGKGTRLYPLTKVISKQLNPVYDKPMIYYPLSVIMLAGIQEILIISTEKDQSLFQKLFEDGSDYGLKISYAIQKEANGIAEAFLIAEEFLGGDSCALILGDNFFYGHGLTGILEEGKRTLQGAVIFPYFFANPKEFGVVTFDQKGNIASLEEKPKETKSNYVVPGIYLFDNTVIQKAKQLTPSSRGELEVIDVLKQYLEEQRLSSISFGRGMAWFDMGTADALLDASNFVRTIQNRQGVKIACLEEIAYAQGWIPKEKVLELAKKHSDSNYGTYLSEMLKGK